MKMEQLIHKKINKDYREMYEENKLVTEQAETKQKISSLIALSRLIKNVHGNFKK